MEVFITMEDITIMEKELKAICEKIKIKLINNNQWKFVEAEQEQSLETSDKYIIVTMEDESILVTVRVKYTVGTIVVEYLDMIDNMMGNNECRCINKCSDDDSRHSSDWRTYVI